jgi:hypothetical protein
LADVHLQDGSDEFCWNLYDNGKNSVNTIYNALIQTDVPVDNNNKLWKLKIPLKIKGIRLVPPEESNSHQR